MILVIMKGGMFFAGQLLPMLRFPLEVEYAHASRYGSKLSGGEVRWTIAPPAAVKGRAVVVLDDILDAGHTLAEVKRQVLLLGASSCRIAVLTEKATGKEKPVSAYFSGITLPERYVFGCGLDISGAWRNLSEIYALKEH